ncbi:hypothetical protein DFH09DRAFT_1086348 [Mycena vulgaris]|nr:hypothetical protein DFH09DRAFT_1086348 [Mycena vulgaris]
MERIARGAALDLATRGERAGREACGDMGRDDMLEIAALDVRLDRGEVAGEEQALGFRGNWRERGGDNLGQQGIRTNGRWEDFDRAPCRVCADAVTRLEQGAQREQEARECVRGEEMGRRVGGWAWMKRRRPSYLSRVVNDWRWRRVGTERSGEFAKRIPGTGEALDIVRCGEFGGAAMTDECARKQPHWAAADCGGRRTCIEKAAGRGRVPRACIKAHRAGREAVAAAKRNGTITCATWAARPPPDILRGTANYSRTSWGEQAGESIYQVQKNCHNITGLWHWKIGIFRGVLNVTNDSRSGEAKKKFNGQDLEGGGGGIMVPEDFSSNRAGSRLERCGGGIGIPDVEVAEGVSKSNWGRASYCQRSVCLRSEYPSLKPEAVKSLKPGKKPDSEENPKAVHKPEAGA